jgi:hypothetical protein
MLSRTPHHAGATLRHSSNSRKKRAAEIGAAMLDRGDTIAEIPFGETSDCLFVSRDRNAVFWTETPAVGSTMLYIGTKTSKPPCSVAETPQNGTVKRVRD